MCSERSEVSLCDRPNMPANLLSCDYFVFQVFQLQCVLRGLKFPCATDQISIFCFVLCSLVFRFAVCYLESFDFARRQSVHSSDPP
jgi:hypothetical protein